MNLSSKGQTHSKYHKSRSRSASNSGSNKASKSFLPHTSIVGASTYSSYSGQSAPSPVFGAYSVPSSPKGIPHLSLDERKSSSSLQRDSLSHNESLKLRTKRSYPNLTSKRSFSPATSRPSIDSPFHRQLDTDFDSISPSKVDGHIQQTRLGGDQLGRKDARQSERREIWDLEDSDALRYVDQNTALYSHPALQDVRTMGDQSGNVKGKASESTVNDPPSKDGFNLDRRLRKVSSNSNLSISSSSSAPVLQTSPSSLVKAKKDASLWVKPDTSKSKRQAMNLKIDGSSSTSLPIIETRSGSPHSSERFKKIRGEHKGLAPELKVDSSSSSDKERSRPSSSLSMSSSISNRSTATNDSSISYSSSLSSQSQDARFLRTNHEGKGKARVEQECQTPTQSSWSRDGKLNLSNAASTSSTTSSSREVYGRRVNLSSSERSSTISYKICPSNALASTHDKAVSNDQLYQPRSHELESRERNGNARGRQRELQEESLRETQYKRSGSVPRGEKMKRSGSSESNSGGSDSHLVMSSEGDVMFAAKLKKGFFKSLSGKIGDVELRKGGADGPIVMQATSTNATSFKKITAPSFNMTRYPSPALVGEYRGLMMDARSSQLKPTKSTRSPRIDLVGDFGHPASPNNAGAFQHQKLDVSGWTGGLKQVDVWGQRWNFSLPKYEEVPLAKALLEQEEEKKSPLPIQCNHYSISNSPALRSTSTDNLFKSNPRSSASNSMPDLNSSPSGNQIVPTSSNRKKISPVETHITSYAIGQRDGKRLFEWVGAGSAKWELIERDVGRTIGSQKVCATFIRQVTVKEGAGVLTFDQDFPDEEMLVLSLITLLDWHMKIKVY